MKYALPAIAILSLLVWGCATFYQKTAVIQNNIQQGDFEAANKQLAKEKKWATNQNRVLYFMNRGVVDFMMGLNEESNQYFNQADYYIEDFSKSMGSEALALISNPMVKPYQPEDFEAIMVNYYKALNYIALSDYEGALVECRRVNIRLQQLNDRYKKNKNKYANDAFAHNLMGLIYDAMGDYNNAFIAYRNAYEIYDDEYTTLFGVTPPLQLKKDLLLSAKKIGFSKELHYYEEKFKMECPSENADEGNLVYIWMTGFGPVKSEWSLNLTNMGVNNGTMIFGSTELGLTFPIFIGNQSRERQSAFKNLSIVRVAFPKYIERPPKFINAELTSGSQKYPLELAQDINKIAFQSLHDRMLRELGNSLLRLATKQVMEQIGSNQNENLGTIISIVNAMTEKADTRNWQSLPYSISYTKIPLQEGIHQLQLNQYGPNAQTAENVSVDIKAGKTTFKVFHQLGGARVHNNY
jgi:hypothetical protein